MTWEPRGRRGVAGAAFRTLYAAVAVALPPAASAAPIPAAPAPAAPFPVVVASDLQEETVAPGVVRATYRLLTAAGPLVVSVLIVDPREPTVRIAPVLAHDTIVSKDETTSSMARRTGAVGGVNGDYFDINATGAPVGILVRNGTLDRTPSARVALTLARDRTIRFDTYRFAGAATSGATTVLITSVNEWPPNGGAALLTPAFGTIPGAAADVTLLELAPLAGAGRYRVASVTTGPPWPEGAALRLAYGTSARGGGPTPDVGDIVTIAYDTDPPLVGVASAIGGGPMLLQAGRAVDDPASPNYADRDRRIPATAAARLADGTLALVVVDGRHPATSIGVNRAELTSLLRALGATDAMLFDSGGSATMVARVLGDASASVVNEPSDGAERPVADGVFVYSDAPVGPPARLVLRPGRVVALPGARVALHARVVDAAGHALGEARGAWHVTPSPAIASIGPDGVLRVGPHAVAASPAVERGGVTTTLPIEVVDRLARIVIEPVRANPDPHGTLMLSAAAFDARDRPVAVDGLVRWTAHDATITVDGRLVAGDRDAAVTASAGGVSAAVLVPVGRHAVPVALTGDRYRDGWKLVTVPASGPGSVAVEDDALRIGYDFTAGGRAAFAVQDVPLGEPIALSCAVEGDASGVAVRATLSDRYGDRQSVTLARTVDFRGVRRVTVAVPKALAPPIVLRNVYVVGTLASPPVSTSGSIAVRDCAESVPGAQPERSTLQAVPATKSAAPSARTHNGGAAATARSG